MYLGKCYIEGSDYIWTSENRNPLNRTKSQLQFTLHHCN